MLAQLIKRMAAPMTPPEPFGAFHLTVMAVGLALGVLLALLLRKTTGKKGRVVLMIVGVLLLVSEVYKQLFWYYAVGYDRYPFSIFPFYICSMPMYLCIPAALLPDGKLRQAIIDFLACWCSIGGLASLFVPEGLSHPYWALTLHAFGWHLVLVFLGLWLGLSGQVGRRKGGFWRAFALYAVLNLAAFYINVAFWKTSGGTIDMFFIGPAPMSVVIYRDIAAVIGRLPVSLFFIGTFSLGAALLYWIFQNVGNRQTGKLLFRRQDG